MPQPVISANTARYTKTIPDVPLFDVEASDDSIGLKAFVCIHALGRYGSSGGLRCASDIERQEVQILARVMTYKYAFFLIDQGGAKAGLQLGYGEPPERRNLLIGEAARHLEPLIRKNLWSPWTDMNFTRADLGTFFAAIGGMQRLPRGGGSSFRTAVSTFAALQAGIDHFGWDPRRTRLAIEGFGSVAGYLAPFLKEIGVKVVAVSTHEGGAWNPDGLDIDALLARQRAGRRAWDQADRAWTPISTDGLFDVETDVFMPAARVHSIDADRAGRLKAQVVLPVANAPSTDAALEILDERGIHCLPGYIVNGGGVCGHLMPAASPENLAEARSFIRIFHPMVLRLLKASDATGISPRHLAAAVANRNYPTISEQTLAGESLRSKVAHRLAALPILPGFLTGRERQARARKTVDHLTSVFT
jgi:glutamate dehydrogenase/leucine dehydrogenase